MFYSTDLLNLRGGRFSIVWELGIKARNGYNVDGKKRRAICQSDLTIICKVRKLLANVGC